MIKALENYCLVEIEKRYQDNIGKIKIDPTWHPEEFATLEGVVVSAPFKVVNDHNRNVSGTVKEGDRVFFSYGVIFAYIKQPDNETPVFKNLIVLDGKEYWKVDVGDIFCVIEDEVRMVTDNILMKRFPVEHQLSNGLRIPTNTEHLGIVVGSNKKSVRVGDTVCFEPKFVQRYNILGEEHLIIPSYRVVGKL